MVITRDKSEPASWYRKTWVKPKGSGIIHWSHSVILAPGVELNYHTTKFCFYWTVVFVVFFFIVCKIKYYNCTCLYLTCEYCIRISLHILKVFTYDLSLALQEKHCCENMINMQQYSQIDDCWWCQNYKCFQ